MSNREYKGKFSEAVIMRKIYVRAKIFLPTIIKKYKKACIK
jgi:hypothetical protein